MEKKICATDTFLYFEHNYLGNNISKQNSYISAELLPLKLNCAAILCFMQAAKHSVKTDRKSRLCNILIV